MAIKILNLLFLGLYREWTHGGDQATKSRRDLELIRLKTLIRYWRSLRGKALIMGDFNFDPRIPGTPHQRSLKEIRGIIESEVMDRGWKQYIHDITRSQEGQESGILDQIYCKQDDFVEHVYRENTTGTDHYCGKE